MDEGEGCVTVFVLLIIGALVWWIIKADKKERAEWEAFSIAHHCVKIRYERATIGTGYTYSGKGGGMATVTIPSKTTYRCDDEMEYVR